MSNTVYVILFFTTLILSRGFIVIFHELGHAFAGMLLYKGNFNVYIGSYGDSTKGLQFKIGRLKIYFIYNPFSWDHGLCVAEQQTVSYKRNFLFTLGGPLGSLTLGFLFLSLLLTGMDQILKVYAFLAFFYAFADFLNNIIPKPKPIILFNGKTTYNDGYQLKSILRRKNNYNHEAKVIDLYNQKHYGEALAYYEKLDKAERNPLILKLAAYSYLTTKNYEASVETFVELQKVDSFTADDHCNSGLANWNSNKTTEAFEHYDKALELAPDHYYTLNNRGYAYNLQEDYEKAILDLNKVIVLSPEFAYAHNNRGFAKIKSGLLEEGLADIEKSLQLDNTNGYAYRNKGIYYLEKKNYDAAYALFLKAKELDTTTHLIDQYLEETLQLKS